MFRRSFTSWSNPLTRFFLPSFVAGCPSPVRAQATHGDTFLLQEPGMSRRPTYVVLFRFLYLAVKLLAEERSPPYVWGDLAGSLATASN